MWREALRVCVGLQLLAGLCSGITVTQKEPFKIIQAGTQASIDCEHDDSTYITILWYRQESNSAQKQLKLIGYSVNENEPVMDLKSYTISRQSGTHASLLPPLDQAADSAVYFCAASKTGGTEKAYFGQGTRLTVLEEGQVTHPPKVTIFAPSAQELQKTKKVTIVCLATNFFPDHVNLTWSMNGVNRREGVKTEEPKYEGTKKTYSLISRLRITSKEWQNPRNNFKCSVDFYNETAKSTYDDTITGVECGGSSAKDKFLRDSNFGKLVYILLICKSALYGAVVMGLKLRKKLMP